MDADSYPREILADEEPKYLRRQKPLEIKRRKLGRSARKTYLRAAILVGLGIAGAWGAYHAGVFLLTAPEMALLHPEQIEISGNSHVSRAEVLENFVADRGRNIFRVPLEKRRSQIEGIPWVERATLRRVLPNKIQVEISERVPVAFLRQGSDMALVDVHGVILDRPLAGDFHFPVVTGIAGDMPQDDRERRMQMFAGFLAQVESARSGAAEQVSEVDLTDEHDLRAMISGLLGVAVSPATTQPAPSPPATDDSGAAANAALETGSGSQDAGPDRAAPPEASQPADIPVLVHFGDSDFQGKFEALTDNIAQWRATAGPIESIDLRFSREAVVHTIATAALQTPKERRAARRSN